MGGPRYWILRCSALAALGVLAGCATPDEGPVVESGGAPIAGLSGVGSTSSAEPEAEGLLAVSGNAMLLGAPRTVVAAVQGPTGPSLAEAAPAAPASGDGPDLLESNVSSAPELALNARPVAAPTSSPPSRLSPVAAGVQGVLAPTSAPPSRLSPVAAGVQGVLAPTSSLPNRLSPVAARVQGVLTPATAPGRLLSPVTVGVQSLLTPAPATTPGAATTQLANALVSTVSRVTAPGGEAAPPRVSPTMPGGTSLGRLVSGLTSPLGN